MNFLDFSNYYIPVNERENRSLFSIFLIWTPWLIIFLSIFILIYFNLFSFFSFFVFAFFLTIHFYCIYYKRKVPYVFPVSALVQNLLIRGIYPLLLIFQPNTASYPIVISLVFYSFLQNMYQKAYFTNSKDNPRHSRKLTKDLVLSDAVVGTKLFYTETTILILSFFLPFQEAISFDIKRITILLFSFNCFTLLFLIKPLNPLVSVIFHRLSKALVIFCALAGFVLILGIQLKNLYFIEYPDYFTDTATSLKTLILIITGDFFVQLSTNDIELYVVIVGIYSFLGIILLSFFTAFLVESNNPYKRKRILGRINYKNAYVLFMYNSQNREETPIEVLYENKIYKCNNDFSSPSFDSQEFNIVDAAALIFKKES